MRTESLFLDKILQGMKIECKFKFTPSGCVSLITDAGGGAAVQRVLLNERMVVGNGAPEGD